MNMNKIPMFLLLLLEATTLLLTSCGGSNNCCFVQAFLHPSHHGQPSISSKVLSNSKSTIRLPPPVPSPLVVQFRRNKRTTTSCQWMSSLPPEGEPEYSREVRLREEAESPFRKIRYFFYLNIAGGATTSLFISIARIAAGLNGVNVDLLEESIRNAIIDIIGLVGVYYFWKQDQTAEESRLKRATKGAELAKLTVRASKTLLLRDVDVDVDDGIIGGTFTTTLSSFRRDRGIEKRIVIAVGGKDKIQQVMREVQELQPELAANDLVLVPVVFPEGIAPILEGDASSTTSSPPPGNVAFPVTVGNNNWKLLVDDESAEATSQGVNIEEDGFCIVLKKNGRVGQRTRGINLDNMVGNVIARKEAGMDVTNI